MMTRHGIHGLLRNLRRQAMRHDSGTTDGQLLEGFLRRRDETAFEELLRRHGPMVLGVCRRVLPNSEDAEDAFQATFLVLVRKGVAMVSQQTLANWLYGVAWRTAQKARVLAARRRHKERRMARSEAASDDTWREWRPVLDQELNRLPVKYREPVVLCDVQGHTRKRASQLLGCPEGTVSVRLSRARAMLAKRLRQRGLTLAAGAAMLAVSRASLTAALPASLSSSTVHAAALVAAGHALTGAVSMPVAILTEGVLKAMLRFKLKVVVAFAVALAAIGISFGVYQARATAAPGNEVVKAPGGSETGKPDPAKGDGKGEEKINLPTGAAPTQVLASLDKDGKLVIKTAIMTVVVPPGGGPNIVPLPAPVPPPPPAGGAGGQGGAAPAGPAGPVGRGQLVPALQSSTYDLDDVKVLDTNGKEIDKKSLPKLLKEETVAMASLWGQPVDPLHLRVLKDGTLTFVLPAPKGLPGVPLGVPGGPNATPPAPAPAPAPAPGGGVAPSSSGTAGPGRTTIAPAPEK